MKHLIVSTYGDYFMDNARRSLEAAAARWDASFHIHHPRFVPSHNWQDGWKFKGGIIDELGEDEQVIILDADILYRRDCPSPFQFYLPGGLAVCNDVQRVGLEPWGHNTLDSQERWEQMLGMPIKTTIPVNGGVIVTDIKTIRKVSLFCDRVCDTTAPLHCMEQCLLSIACKRLGIPMVIMPDWVNNVNIAVKLSYVFNGPMRLRSMHYAGIGRNPTKESIQTVEWEKVSKEALE